MKWELKLKENYIILNHIKNNICIFVLVRTSYINIIYTSMTYHTHINLNIFNHIVNIYHKNDDLLIIKSEIGFAIDKYFNNTETKFQSFGFSIYGSYEEKLDGTTSKAKIKDTSSNFDIVDDNTDDTFVTVGLGYNLENKENNTLYNFGIYHTQNDDDNLNSSLISYNYKKTF